jgi:hypothetical protein
MASWRLMHRATGAVLTGYIVLSASPAEIEQANSNLRTSGSGYRYVPNQHEAVAAASGEVVQTG